MTVQSMRCVCFSQSARRRKKIGIYNLVFNYGGQMLWECEIRTQWDDEGEKENHKLKLNICHIESPKSQPHFT